LKTASKSYKQLPADSSTSCGASTVQSEPNLFVFIRLQLFYSKTAQKTHVKPRNNLTHSQPTTSIWHFSYAQLAILDTQIEKEAKPCREIDPSGANSFVCKNLGDKSFVMTFLQTSTLRKLLIAKRFIAGQ
jgi:hypothetical protein